MRKLNATDAEQDKFDIQSELNVISYALSCGTQNFYSNLDELSFEQFSGRDNASVYKTICDLYEKESVEGVTEGMLYSYARTSGVPQDIIDNKYNGVFEAAIKKSITKDEAKLCSKNIKHWFIVRKLQLKIDEAKKLVSSAKGSDNIIDLISSVEESIFNLVPEIKKDNDFVNIAEYAVSHIDYLAKNPVTMAGIPTGFPRYDQCIGGGYRRGTVNVVGARPKIGKSTYCLNIAKNISYANIPVLYLDTEMKKETQAIKWASLCSGFEQNEIETGAFGKNEKNANIIRDKIEEAKSKPFYHISVAGMKPEEIFAICRRWLSNVVGKNPNGSIKDCLIILDYLKTMDLGDLGDFQEYQYLGDFVTKLHNFAVKYDLPILATVQLNRDGINKDDSSVVSGSDRILWLCSSLAYLKKKTDEDVAAGDNKANGDRKLVVIDTRYGKGMDASSEYINVVSSMGRSEMLEGKFNFEIIDSPNNSSDDEEELNF